MSLKYNFRKKYPRQSLARSILAITHISNLVSTSLLEGLILYKVSIRKVPILSYLCLPRSTVYVFIHEEKRRVKSAKWEPRRKRGILVDYDDHTIY